MGRIVEPWKFLENGYLRYFVENWIRISKKLGWILNLFVALFVVSIISVSELLSSRREINIKYNPRWDAVAAINAATPRMKGKYFAAKSRYIREKFARMIQPTEPRFSPRFSSKEKSVSLPPPLRWKANKIFSRSAGLTPNYFYANYPRNYKQGARGTTCCCCYCCCNSRGIGSIRGIERLQDRTTKTK